MLNLALCAGTLILSAKLVWSGESALYVTCSCSFASSSLATCEAVDNGHDYGDNALCGVLVNDREIW